MDTGWNKNKPQVKIITKLFSWVTFAAPIVQSAIISDWEFQMSLTFFPWAGALQWWRHGWRGEADIRVFSSHVTWNRQKMVSRLLRVIIKTMIPTAAPVFAHLVLTEDQGSYLFAFLRGHVLDNVQRCQALLVYNVNVDT